MGQNATLTEDPEGTLTVTQRQEQNEIEKKNKLKIY